MPSTSRSFPTVNASTVSLDRLRPRSMMRTQAASIIPAYKFTPSAAGRQREGGSASAPASSPFRCAIHAPSLSPQFLATAAEETPYSRVRQQPATKAKTSPSVT